MTEYADDGRSSIGCRAPHPDGMQADCLLSDSPLFFASA